MKPRTVMVFLGTVLFFHILVSVLHVYSKAVILGILGRLSFYCTSVQTYQMVILQVLPPGLVSLSGNSGR